VAEDLACFTIAVLALGQVLKILALARWSAPLESLPASRALDTGLDAVDEVAA
jgi:hypothetical protein